MLPDLDDAIVLPIFAISQGLFAAPAGAGDTATAPRTDAELEVDARAYVTLGE